MFYRFQLFSLRREVTGNLQIEPVLDLCRQMDDFDRHSVSPYQVPGLAVGSHGDRPNEARGRLILASNMDIAHLADRFQYLSVRIWGWEDCADRVAGGAISGQTAAVSPARRVFPGFVFVGFGPLC